MLLEWLKTDKTKSVLVMLGIKVFKKKRQRLKEQSHTNPPSLYQVTPAGWNNGLCLGQCSVAAKRCHDHGNSRESIYLVLAYSSEV